MPLVVACTSEYLYSRSEWGRGGGGKMWHGSIRYDVYAHFVQFVFEINSSYRAYLNRCDEFKCCKVNVKPYFCRERSATACLPLRSIPCVHASTSTSSAA